ncbi:MULTISPECIES: CGNR zinc finger domain-containing protein [Streptacidiphilus]|uniref:CGNR zinc finger domain-containing protein n=1 Tax=Streptacidiphilus TaxID=228398 RepID=UPI001E39882D|nr:CGNR zinc finger domain-containing protein [Streptacidiphilus jeojiense]
MSESDPDLDLDLAVELVNTVYALAAPPDRLTNTGAYQHILREARQDALADELTPADLPALRELRDSIAPLFAATDLTSASTLLNPLLSDAALVPQLATTDDGAHWVLSTGLHGLAALRARLLGALAAHLVRHGTARLGVCQAAPCTCAFVDRSRARTRRYCCDQCNDRAAATAYRRRRT